MTHHYHHDHDHDHNHDHDHDHDHNHNHEDAGSPLSFEEKMIKRLEHWIRHNTDHADTYRDWADKAKKENLTDAGDLLEAAAELTIVINKKLETAIKKIK